MLASTEWMLPALLKPLIDESVDSTNTGIRTVPFLLVVLFLFRGLFSYISTVSLHLVAQKAIEDMRNALFSKLLRLDIGFFDGNSVKKIYYYQKLYVDLN